MNEFYFISELKTKPDKVNTDNLVLIKGACVESRQRHR